MTLNKWLVVVLLSTVQYSNTSRGFHTFSSSGKAYITNVIQNLPDSIKRKPVLDIGAGSGTYSNLFKGMLIGPWTGGRGISAICRGI